MHKTFKKRIENGQFFLIQMNRMLNAIQIQIQIKLNSPLKPIKWQQKGASFRMINSNVFVNRLLVAS